MSEPILTYALIGPVEWEVTATHLVDIDGEAVTLIRLIHPSTGDVLSIHVDGTLQEDDVHQALAERFGCHHEVVA